MTSVTVFACTRTDLGRKKLPQSVRLIELPCTGRVSIPLLLATVARGNDGVLVLGRHQETCRLRGAEDPARDRALRAGELVQMAGFGSDRIVFSNPDPGLSGPERAVEQFLLKVEQIGPTPKSLPLSETAIGVEGIDTSLELVRWMVAHPRRQTDLTSWLKSNDLSTAGPTAPALVPGILPFLDLLTGSLIRPVRLPEVVKTALAVLVQLGFPRVGVFPQAWTPTSSDKVRVRTTHPQLFTFSDRGKRKLAEAELEASTLTALLREKGQTLARPPVRAAVATDGSKDQNELIEVLGYEPVDAGPDPLPDSFTMTPEHRVLAEQRLAKAEARGAIALLTTGPHSLAQWALLARQGTWRSTRVLPVLPHLLAYLSCTGRPLTLRSLENPLAASCQQVVS